MSTAVSTASNLPTSLTFLSLFSVLLGTAILGTAGHVLQTFSSQRASNPWWLPVWPAHFDARGLRALLACSATIVALDGLIVAASRARLSRKEHNSSTAANIQFLQASSRAAVLALSVLAAIVGLISIIMPAVINNAAPGTDSMQTWTCEWSSASGAPGNFRALCNENVSKRFHNPRRHRRPSLARALSSASSPTALMTPILFPPPANQVTTLLSAAATVLTPSLHPQRFAYFANIPLFVAQLLILGLAVQTRLASGREHRRISEEKGEELGSVVTGTATAESRDGAESAQSGKGLVVVHNSRA
ncbi:hypothetical protein MBLNU459_g3688t1 [Dothideomycetes sp. NU459]